MGPRVFISDKLPGDASGPVPRPHLGYQELRVDLFKQGRKTCFHFLVNVPFNISFTHIYRKGRGMKKRSYGSLWMIFRRWERKVVRLAASCFVCCASAQWTDTQWWWGERGQLPKHRLLWEWNTAAVSCLLLQRTPFRTGGTGVYCTQKKWQGMVFERGKWPLPTWEPTQGISAVICVTYFFKDVFIYL